MKKDMFKKIGMLAVSATLACGAGSSEAMKQPDATGAGSAGAKVAAVPASVPAAVPGQKADLYNELITVNSVCIGIAQNIVKGKEGLDISALSALIRSVFNSAFVPGVESVFAPEKGPNKWDTATTTVEMFKKYGITLAKGGIGNDDIKALLGKVVVEKTISLKDAVGKKLNNYKFTESVVDVEKLLQFIGEVVKSVDGSSFEKMESIKQTFKSRIDGVSNLVKGLEKALNVQQGQDIMAVALEKIAENEKLNKTIDELQKALKIKANVDVVKEASKKVAENEELGKVVDDLQKVLNVQQGQNIIDVASEKVAANENFSKVVDELKKTLKISADGDIMKEVSKKITENEKNNELFDEMSKTLGANSVDDIMREFRSVLANGNTLSGLFENQDKLIKELKGKIDGLQVENTKIESELKFYKEVKSDSDVVKFGVNRGVAKLMEDTVKKATPAAPAAPAAKAATEAAPEALASFASLFSAI